MTTKKKKNKATNNKAVTVVPQKFVPKTFPKPASIVDYDTISKAIDYRIMEDICTLPTEILDKYLEALYPEAEITYDIGGNIFIDNKANILGVAHRDNYGTDYGGNDFHFQIVKDRIYNASLDDRLGVYLLVDLLAKFGLEYDILITTDEEIGNSTAMYFKPSEDRYNWIFQFDRRGTDVVTYSYIEDAWIEAIEDTFFKLGHGSFSDICYLDGLGVSAMNIGTAYYNEHTPYSYVAMPEFIGMVSYFLQFYGKYADTKFKHTPKPKTTYVGKSYDWYNPNWKSEWYRDLDELDEAIANVYRNLDELDEDDAKVGKRTSLHYELFCETCGYAFDDDDPQTDGVCSYCWEYIMEETDYDNSTGKMVSKEDIREQMTKDGIL